jgi:two-component system, chemotaxis family, chemotaxis protein CheY
MKYCLLVEQSEVIRKVAKRILEDENFVVIEAVSGQAALDVVKRAMPPFIFLDWQLPGLSALDFLAAIGPMITAENRPRIVYCTTEHDPAHFAKVYAAGVDDVLLKPFTRKMFVGKLHKLPMAA